MIPLFTTKASKIDIADHNLDFFVSKSDLVSRELRVTSYLFSASGNTKDLRL